MPFFRKALDANSTVEQFWISYIDALIKAQKTEDAKAALAQAKDAGVNEKALNQLTLRVDSNPDEQTSVENLIDKATELRELGKYKEAIKLLKEGINKFPKDPHLLSLLSHCHILANNIDEANLNLLKAKEIDPNLASIGWNEARLLLKKKYNEQALKIATKTNSQFPNDAEGLAVVGACLRAKNKIEQALIYLSKALEVKPDYAEAYLQGDLYIFLKAK